MNPQTVYALIINEPNCNTNVMVFNRKQYAESALVEYCCETWDSEKFDDMCDADIISEYCHQTNMKYEIIETQFYTYNY